MAPGVGLEPTSSEEQQIYRITLSSLPPFQARLPRPEKLAKKNCTEDDDTSTYLEVILDSARRGANLTRHLLNYAGQDLVESELLDMNDIVREASSFLEQSLERNILLKTDLDPNIGPISGDKSMLLQALINLALNSREAMPEGGELDISTAKSDSFIEIYIKDTGVGISRKNLKKVFDPFFTTKAKGTGLGLSTAKMVVESHNGIIQIDSEEGKGTMVTVRLPITP